MVTALMLINTERRLVDEVADALIEIDGVTEVYSVAGKYDLIALLRSKSNDEMADLVIKGVHEIDGIERRPEFYPGSANVDFAFIGVQ